jgi:hypothetical protein
VILLSFICHAVSLATDVSGDVWGEWTADGNPYIVIGDIRVPQCSTLLVGPGTFIVFSDTAYKLLIDTNAVFVAEGTFEDSVIILFGKGLKFFNSSDSSRLIYCGIYYTLEYYTGAIHAVNCDLRIEHCSIKHNVALHNSIGGGIIGIGSNLMLCHNQIINNRSVVTEQFQATRGGGIYLSHSDATIIGNIIAKNITQAGIGDAYGGGIYCEHSTLILINNTITGNKAYYSNPYNPPYHNYVGSGIFAWQCSLIILNSIIWGNVESDIDDWGYSIYNASYSDLGDSILGQGNIDVDPLFRDPANGDFHLMSVACGDSADSPCIDAGDPNILDGLLDCSWGLGTTISDMGAYGGGDSTTVGIFDNMPTLPDRFILLQNYPNPFNSATTIEYSLSEAGRVRIDIYDLLGRKVETLVDEEKQVGQHRVVWDASGHSSGIYFYRIEAGDYTETRKMILLK